MGEKYKRLNDIVIETIKSAKGKFSRESFIEKLHKVLPTAPNTVKIPF